MWGVHGGRQGDGYASCELPLVSGMCGVCMEGGRVMVMLAVHTSITLTKSSFCANILFLF